MSDIEIRLATFEDVAQITILAEQLGYPTSEGDMACRLAELFQQPNDAVCVAVTPGGDVVGWIHLYVHRSLVSAPLTMIGGLIVDKSCRQQGIGRQLMTYAENWGQARGCDAVYIKSNVTREAAHAFYSRLGYEQVKTQYAFRKAL